MGEPDKVEKRYFSQIKKVDDEKRIVWGVVLQPEVVDGQGDIISSKEIEKTAHGFMLNSRVIGEGHMRKAQADVVESFLAPIEFEMNDEKVLKGSWVMGVKIFDDRIWDEVKSGKLGGFSIGGFGVRREVSD